MCSSGFLLRQRLSWQPQAGTQQQVIPVVKHLAICSIISVDLIVFLKVYTGGQGTGRQQQYEDVRMEQSLRRMLDYPVSSPLG